MTCSSGTSSRCGGTTWTPTRRARRCSTGCRSAGKRRRSSCATQPCCATRRLPRWPASWACARRSTASALAPDLRRPQQRRASLQAPRAGRLHRQAQGRRRQPHQPRRHHPQGPRGRRRGQPAQQRDGPNLLRRPHRGRCGHHRDAAAKGALSEKPAMRGIRGRPELPRLRAPRARYALLTGTQPARLPQE